LPDPDFRISLWERYHVSSNFAECRYCLGSWHIVLDGYPAHPQKGQNSPQFFGPCLSWPNGWMDQDAIWYRGRPLPRPHCVRRRPSFTAKSGHSSLPIFGSCLLWPNGWMDYNATCYGGKPRPRRHCVRWVAASPHLPSPKRTLHSPHFSVHVYSGQAAGWIRIPLGTEVGLDPGVIV